MVTKKEELAIKRCFFAEDVCKALENWIQGDLDPDPFVIKAWGKFESLRSEYKKSLGDLEKKVTK